MFSVTQWGTAEYRHADNTSQYWLDVNGDDRVYPLDALLVINYLNAQNISGESLWSSWDEKIRREGWRAVFENGLEVGL